MKKEKTIYPKLTKPYRKEMLTSLRKFVAIDSVYDETSVDKENPFGKGVSKALNFIEELAKKDGFEVHNYDNMIVEILAGKGDKNITILAHADVVPTGTGWKHDPFTVYEKFGTLYGRGVADDKGPLLASYYALKALRDHNLLGDYTVRFLVGGNEESGSRGVSHYFEELKKPQTTLGFSPDSNFPLTFAEKGIIGFKCEKKIDLPELVSLEAGVAPNSVIEKCDVVVNDEGFATYLKNNKIDCFSVKEGANWHIVFHGKAAHGSMPWLGVNAGLIAIKALGEYFNNEDLLHAYKCYSDPYAKGVNANAHNEEMKDNSLNVGIITYENGIMTFILNFRYINTCKEEKMIDAISKASIPFSTEIAGTSPLLYYPQDSDLVKTLLSSYQIESGDYKTKPQTSGGGTYAKETTNTVAFGMEMPGYDCYMHAPKERIKKKHLYLGMSVYAHAIVELGKKL